MPSEPKFVTIDYGISQDAIFLTDSELNRLKAALKRRPEGQSTISIRYRGRPEYKLMTTTIVLDRIITITP